MKLRHGSVFVLLALCLAGCESTPAPSPPTSVPSTEAPTEAPTESGPVPGTIVTPVPNSGGGGKTTPSKGKAQGGALGSPIDYDPSFVGASLESAVVGINTQLKTLCGASLCDVKTKPKYEGPKGSDQDCVVKRFDYDRPLRHGATITIAVKCPVVSSQNTTTTSSSSNQ
jgi:hypothetical protein